MPPLLVVVAEALPLHGLDQHLSVAEYAALSVGGMSGFSKGVERRSHIELGTGSELSQGEVHSQAEVMPTPARDVTLVQQVQATGSPGPIYHSESRSHRPISI